MGGGREEEELFILAASYWTIYQNEFRFTIHYAFQLVLCKGANGFSWEFRLCCLPHSAHTFKLTCGPSAQSCRALETLTTPVL